MRDSRNGRLMKRRMIRGTRNAFLLLAVTGMVLFASCGHQLIMDKGIYGGEISSLSVPVFKNRSYEPHAPLAVTEAFTRELASTGLFQVNKDGADGHLDGVIKAIRVAPSSLSTAGVVVEKQITAEVELTLFQKNGALVRRWTVSESEIYRVDNQNFEDHNRRDALKRMSGRMARKFASMLLADY